MKRYIKIIILSILASMVYSYDASKKLFDEINALKGGK